MVDVHGREIIELVYPKGVDPTPLRVVAPWEVERIPPNLRCHAVRERYGAIGYSNLIG